MTSDKPGSPTIATIATELGVSAATVSKVLNGRSDVAPETRARVEASLERHSYRSRVPRQTTASSAQIHLVFHEFDSEWAMEIIQGVEAVTAVAGHDVVLSQLGGRHHPSQPWLDAVLHRRPLGVLFVVSSPTQVQQQQLQRRRIPFVVIDTDSATSASVPTVGSSNFNGGLQATRHLLELGHERLAVISGQEDVLCSRERVAGFRFAHEEAGIAADAELVRYGNFSVESGYRHGMDLLNRRDRPTAIFAGADMQAVGVLRAARRLGLRVPDDLSLIGYDNLPMAAWTDPALTTINQPLRDMAGTAARILLDLARGVPITTTRIDLVTELIVRESTAPPTSS